METIFSQNSHRYVCNICNIKTNNKKDYTNHLMTPKHKKLSNVNTLDTNFSPISQNPKISIINNFICELCDKCYKSRVGLWKHKKICSPENNELGLTDKEIIKALINQTDKLMKLVENGVTSNSHNTTNNDNKTFNLNFFLNETCKDALNIQEFVSSIKVNLDDLEFTGRNGYIEGITNIIFKNLTNLEKNERPIHCSDVKREVLYIKDDNQWIKETDQKPILTKAIKTIANENIKKIKHWKEINPDCTDSDSKKNNLYLKIVSNSMNGLTQEEADKNINKIISNVAKEVTINK
jgi:hypothetical protein